MARRFSPRELVLQLQSAGYTQKEIARRAGVHPRTIRKWKSGETKPAPQRVEKLSRQASSARRRLADTIEITRDEKIVRKQSSRTRGHRLPRDVPIPRAIRQEIKNYRHGKWKKEYGYRLSDWINYDVRGWNVSDIVAFVRALYKTSARERPYVQVTFLAPVEDQSISGTPYLANKRMQRSGSGLRDLGGADVETVIRWVRDALDVKGRRPMYVAIARNPQRDMRERDEDEDE